MHGSKFPDTKHGENSGYSKIERKTSLPVELIFVVLLGTGYCQNKTQYPLKKCLTMHNLPLAYSITSETNVLDGA